VKTFVWSGAGSNCRPSAFQVNRAKRCADLRKRMSLTSGTALSGRCKIHASRTRYTPSTRQDSDPTQDHRDRRWRDHDRHPVGTRRWPVRTVPTPRATRRIPASQRPSGERRQLARQIIPAVSATARSRSRRSSSPIFDVFAVYAAGPGLRRGHIIYSGVYAAREVMSPT
jgi:hypothetical protein